MKTPHKIFQFIGLTVVLLGSQNPVVARTQAEDVRERLTRYALIDFVPWDWAKIRDIGKGKGDGKDSRVNAEPGKAGSGDADRNGNSVTTIRQVENRKTGKARPSTTPNTGSSGSGSGNPSRGRPPQKKTYWIPLCFFFDPAYGSEYGRSTVKTVVDAFAKCDIAVEPHATTLRDLTYNPHDPDKLNAYANFHCNVKSFYGDASVNGAAQTHPDSIEASDRMCAKDLPAWFKKKSINPRDPSLYLVGGCAKTPGTESIVDKNGGGGVATHEFGHNVGRAGRGGGILENSGEGGFKIGQAGFGLQQQDTPLDRNKAGQPEPPEGSEDFSGQSFTEPYGCASLRGGANLNTNNRVMYYPDAYETYYTRLNDPRDQLDFSDRSKIFLPPRNQSVQIASQNPPPLSPPRVVSLPAPASALDVDAFKSKTPAPLPSISDGHKKQSEIGAMGPDESVTSRRKGKSSRNAAQEAAKSIYNVPQPRGKLEGEKTFRFDENAGELGKLSAEEKRALLRGEAISSDKAIGNSSSGSPVSDSQPSATSEKSAETRRPATSRAQNEDENSLDSSSEFFRQKGRGKEKSSRQRTSSREPQQRRSSPY